MGTGRRAPTWAERGRDGPSGRLLHEFMGDDELKDRNYGEAGEKRKENKKGGERLDRGVSRPGLLYGSTERK